MWPFDREPTRASLEGHRKVVIMGQRFTIRRLSPLVDFPADRMPQIFTDTTRAPKPDFSLPSVQKKALEGMYDVLLAGVVEPKLVPVGSKKEGFTPDDIFRDADVGRQLYMKIIEHSLFRLRTWQVPLFLAVKMLLRFMNWLKNMGSVQANSSTAAA